MKAMRGAMCTCTLGWTLVAILVLAVGAWAFVFAVHTQWTTSAGAATLLPWYFGALLLLWIGRMLKWKAHGDCPVHGSMK